MGKSYEKTRDITDFIAAHQRLFPEIIRVLKTGGSLCWQIGNHVYENEVTPLDYCIYRILEDFPLLKLRNRIVWTFGHGLHCKRRFSGRHETILWFTKGKRYYFNLNAVRIKQKYPGKLGYKGTKKGKPSGNPLGKNPSDVWDPPNVKGKHPEKTIHPCQFPVAIPQRLILALTKKNGVVLDPFMGSGASGIAAVAEGRRFIGAELKQSYYRVAQKQIMDALDGTVRFRPHNRPLYVPGPNEKVAIDPFIIPLSHESKKAC